MHTFDDISLNQGFEIRKVNNVLKLNLSNMLLFSIYEGNTKKPVFQAILLPLGHFKKKILNPSKLVNMVVIAKLAPFIQF